MSASKLRIDMVTIGEKLMDKADDAFEKARYLEGLSVQIVTLAGLLPASGIAEWIKRYDIKDSFTLDELAEMTLDVASEYMPDDDAKTSPRRDTKLTNAKGGDA